MHAICSPSYRSSAYAVCEGQRRFSLAHVLRYICSMPAISTQVAHPHATPHLASRRAMLLAYHTARVAPAIMYANMTDPNWSVELLSSDRRLFQDYMRLQCAKAYSGNLCAVRAGWGSADCMLRAPAERVRVVSDLCDTCSHASMEQPGSHVILLVISRLEPCNRPTLKIKEMGSWKCRTCVVCHSV